MKDLRTTLPSVQQFTKVTIAEFPYENMKKQSKMISETEKKCCSSNVSAVAMLENGFEVR